MDKHSIVTCGYCNKPGPSGDFWTIKGTRAFIHQACAFELNPLMKKMVECLPPHIALERKIQR